MSVIPPPKSTGSSDPTWIGLFALTIFLSAFLLFQVQPLISKFILPWFGGSPAVWTTAMLFFQCILFGGYVYAHLLGRHVVPRGQVAIHLLLLLLAAVIAVWILPGISHKPTGAEDPGLKILLLLVSSIGLPYFCLSTTGPLLQYWFMHLHPGRSVFRLYALSNIGSFLALLSFPYLLEPRFELHKLGDFWALGFWAFAVLCAVITLRVASAADRISAAQAPADNDEKPVATTAAQADGAAPAAWPQRLMWVLLPALASLTFIATTDHVSHDVAPEPRLWIATLSLYLLTFILSFDHPRWYQRTWTAAVCLLGVLLLSGRHDIPDWFGLDWDFGVTPIRWFHFGVMFLICLMSHGELYRLRPGNARQLTEFYLLMSLGGACGGLFVSLVATHFFSDYHEWTISLVGAIVLACWILGSRRTAAARPRAWPALIGGAAALALLLYWEDPLSWRDQRGDDYEQVTLEQSRNFYGTILVTERKYPKDPSQDYRAFYSGQILHGVQYLDPAKRHLPISYYSEKSGVGETLLYAAAQKARLDVALVGLGAGTLATYAREADHYDFYEINPQAVQVAQHWFGNLASCRAQTRNMLLGDARLKFEQLPDSVQYDVIVLDAFSGDSVPIHLLTREAFQIYRRHLKPDGFIVTHITNTYLNLYPVLRRQAEELQIGFRNKYQSSDRAHKIWRSHYFVMTNNQDYLQRYPSVNRKILDDQGRVIGERDPNLPGVPLWTDHFSSLNPIELPESD